VADSKSGMNLPSRTATVLTDLRSGISGTIQDTVRLKQEWTSVGQAIQTAGSRAGGLAKGGGPGGGLSSSKIAPDPNFGQQQQASNNQVFSSPAQNAIGGGNNGGGPTGPVGGTGGSDGNGMFRNLSEYVSQNRTGAILYGAGTALGSAHATSDMVQTQLLMQRAAANLPKDPGMSVDKSGVPIVGFGTTDIFGRLSANHTSKNSRGAYTSRYEFIRNAANEMAFGGAPNDKMDAFNAMAAAQSYGVGGAANFMQRAGTNDQFAGSVMSGVSNVSNLTPGMGLEGTTRAYGGMQRAKSVNMLRSVGIKIRDESGNMKPMDVIIDDLWTKICRDVMKDGKGKPTEREMLIGFQPGNSMDSMVQNLFGDDPLVYTAIKNGLIYKARTGGAAITREGALDAGMTTSAVQERQETMSYGTQGLGQVANRGAKSYFNTQNGVNAITSLALAGDAMGGPYGGPLKLLNSTAAMLQTLGGTPGGSAVANFFAGMLGLKGKAEGGSVGNKQPYIVGEKGPELFVPKTDGTIVPNHELGPFRHHGGGVQAGGVDMSKSQWAKALLGKLNAPISDANTAAIEKWMGAEGGHWKNTAGYNPLNTTYSMSGSTLMDAGPGRDAGVRHYTDWKQGLNATVNTLTGNLANERGYTKIVKLLKSGASSDEIYKAILDSSWGTGKGSGATGGSGSGTGSDTTVGANVSLTAEDNKLIKSSFISVYGDKKGAELFKAFETFNKTGKLPSDTTVASLLGMNSGDAAAMAAGLGGGGSTVNYGGVTFNITTPADNKSFVDSVKQALKDLNFLKIGRD
jgi:hypothetical protein